MNKIVLQFGNLKYWSDGRFGFVAPSLYAEMVVKASRQSFNSFFVVGSFVPTLKTSPSMLTNMRMSSVAFKYIEWSVELILYFFSFYLAPETKYVMSPINPIINKIPINAKPIN